MRLKYTPYRGLSIRESSRLTPQSKAGLDKYITEAEETRKALGLQGEAIVMALMGKEDIWKFGTLKL